MASLMFKNSLDQEKAALKPASQVDMTLTIIGILHSLLLHFGCLRGTSNQ
jgi:hypothetical protein